MIRVVDLVFVIKDADGHVDWAEIEDQEDDLKEVAQLLGHKGDLPLLTEDDVQKLGATHAQRYISWHPRDRTALGYTFKGGSAPCGR